ncbi:hypothetical protein [Silicimonas sp. MF1-12-2]|jgi:hypothetical protein|uniref:hypothetical protein n=1 Tax=Silicimonas sp. MF1-12-2 TaxID=3384793 RepID=UPI0039B45523
MSLRNKRRELHGVVGALGVVAALGGFVANYYSPGTTIVLIFAIIAVGATLVNVFTDPPGKG